MNKIEDIYTKIEIGRQIAKSMLDQEDYGGQVDGECFAVIAEWLMEFDEEMCNEPL